MSHVRVSSRRSRVQIEQLVLGVLEKDARLVSAYDIALALTASGETIAPNQVYRTLARLIDLKVIHRLETRPAYTLRRGDFDACLICDDCARVTFIDTPSEVAALTGLGLGKGFTPLQVAVEMSGRCADCLSQDIVHTEAPPP